MLQARKVNLFDLCKDYITSLMHGTYWAADMACAHIETCCIKARCGYTSSYRRGCVQLMLSLNFHNKTCVFIYHGFSSYKTKHFQMLFFHFLPTLLNLILTYVEMVPVCVWCIAFLSFRRNMVLFLVFLVMEKLALVRNFLRWSPYCSVLIIPSLHYLLSLKIHVVL